VSRSTTVSGLSISNGSAFCLQWTGDDANGSGSRDEYGIDDVSVTPTGSATLVELLSFTATTIEDTVALIWETAVEVNNAGFNLYRAVNAGGPYERINDLLIGSQAQPGQGAIYEYNDTPGKGTFFYKLEDIDTSGVATQHDPVQVTVEAATTPELLYRIFLPVMQR
jgi:hypothetical protein